MIKYKITKEKTDIYRGIIILNEMINNHRLFPIIGNNDVETLKPLLISMSNKGLVKLENNEFKPTEKGRENLLGFYNKFYEFVKIFQIFSAVDLENGTFAYDKYWQMGEEAFLEFINEPQFEDCRIAIAEFKKIDPIEIVFMSFLNENKIDVTASDWAFNLISDLIYDEIIDICNCAIHAEDLQDGDAILAIVEQGSKLAIKLITEEAEILKAAQTEDELNNQNNIIQDNQYQESYYVEEIREEYYEPDYYYGYYDPYYISPLWLFILL